MGTMADGSEQQDQQRAPERSTALPGPRLADGQPTGSAPWHTPSRFDDVWLRFAVAMAACLVLFPGIGSFGLWDPWEVHYGAVGWGFMERGDWISPWWGSYWTAPGKSMEGEWFFSKPVLLLWMMGVGMEVFGFNATGIRFGVTLIAAMGVFSVYLMGSRVWSRRVGVLMALCLLTSPFYAMLGRQAQTDMPFVGPMTIALSFFVMGAFGKDRNERAPRALWLMFWGFVAAIVLPQLHTITVGQLEWRTDVTTVEALVCYGPVQLGFYLLLFAIVALSTWRSPNKTRGQVYLYVFYVFIGLATMGKGILGFALPGAIIFVYLLVSREWRMLARLEIPRGALITLIVGMPWYAAVMARHGGVGGPWWNRFIIHDHFKRLASGVHQTDTGSFEHFIKWLGYGLFPWGSFVPAIIARALSGDAGSQRTDEDRARLFLFLWFAIAFTLFTLSSTKFHHYIFPAVPALALLAALFLDDVLEGAIPWASYWPLYLAAGSLFLVVGFDLMTEPQHLKNMFTYKYDRRWDHDTWDAGLTLGLTLLVGLGAIGMLLLARPKNRIVAHLGVGVLGLQGVLFVLWALNVYMPAISSTWSQHGLWETYYHYCTRTTPPPGAHRLKQDRYCEDSAIAYKLNWRGETYFTMNEVLPIRDDEEWDHFIEINDGRCFFAIMEQSRVGSYRNALPADQRDGVQEVPIVNPDGTSEAERAAYLAEREENGWTFWERLLQPGYQGDDNIKFALVAANCELQLTEDEPSDGSGEGSGQDLE